MVVGFFLGVFTWMEEGFRAQSFFQGTVFGCMFALIIALLVGLPLLRVARKRKITNGFYYARMGGYVAAAVVLGVVFAVRKFDGFAAKAAVVLVISGVIAGWVFSRIANASTVKAAQVIDSKVAM